MTDKNSKPLQNKAGKAYNTAIMVDTHSDTLCKTVDDVTWLPVTDIGKDTPFDVDIPKLKKGGVNVQCFAAYTPGYYTNGRPDYRMANSRLLSLINALYWITAGNSEEMGLAKTVKDIECLTGNGKIAAVLAIEGAYSLNEEEGEELLYQYYDLGVRIMGPLWNYSNVIGEGSYCTFLNGVSSDGGLTDFGREIIEKMNQLGIIIDVSHMNERTFKGVFETTNSPIIASHSGVYALRNHVRNLKDYQIKAIAQTGGVVQVVFYPGFLAVSEAGVGIETIVDHIKYITDLVGVEHVGMGSDFDGAKMPTDIKDASKTIMLKKALKSRGYGADEIESIMGKNTMRVMREVWVGPATRDCIDAPVIRPRTGMDRSESGAFPELYATVEAAEGLNIDKKSLRVIVDGKIHTPEFIPETGTVSLKLKEPLHSGFHVTSFVAANTDGRLSRKAEIFHLLQT